MDTDNIRQQLMELWKRSFDDTDAFVRLFFTHVYRKENALYIEQGGRIVSALQMLPYTMQFYGKEIPVSYIYGACTHPEERGKGWMSALIQKAFKVMAERHIALTVIIPAEKSLFDYYRRFGYTEAFDYATETIFPLQTTIGEDTDITVASADASQQESLFHYFDRKQRERPCYVLHNQKDFVPVDPAAYEKRVLNEERGLIPQIDPRYRYTYFYGIAQYIIYFLSGIIQSHDF